jgi:hypothetical protein
MTGLTVIRYYEITNAYLLKNPSDSKLKLIKT